MIKNNDNSNHDHIIPLPSFSRCSTWSRASRNVESSMSSSSSAEPVNMRNTVRIKTREGMRSRSGTAEPKRTVEFRNRPEPDAERNRTESDRAMARPKSADRTVSNRKNEFPNRTEPMNFRKVRNRNESNRTCSFPLLGAVLRVRVLGVHVEEVEASPLGGVLYYYYYDYHYRHYYYDYY